jgi:maltose/maltodextrin transport system permease protein
MNRATLFKWSGLSLLAASLLWVVFGIYLNDHALLALGLLAFGAIALYIYGSAKTQSWRYLFPGVAGMLVFVALPLFYTIQIGFTNYSASNLLSLDRARAYLLSQATTDEDQSLVFSLHPDGAAFRLVLSPHENQTGASYVSPDLSLKEGKAEVVVPMRLLGADAPTLAQPLSLREVIERRDALMALKLALPDQTTLSYTGVREFGSFEPLWKANPNGSLTQMASNTVFTPNMESGFFESTRGERIQPGFKVGIGWTNYTRILFDADMRGPFFSIFIWTVVFAGLTVLFSTALGMTLAVVLNWESLRYRTLYRTLLFLPYAVPGFISILVFKGLFNQNFGEINTILNAAFGVRPAWFADPTLAKSMLLIVNTWLGYPYIMVLCTGLIKAIPADLYEASAIAGAKPLTNFFRITVPLIARPLTPLLISAFAFNFNNFVLISLLTDGRPDYLNTKLPAGTTDILVSYTYRIAFTDAGANFGLAAAISTLIFFMVALLSMANLKLTHAGEPKRN